LITRSVLCDDIPYITTFDTNSFAVGYMKDEKYTRYIDEINDNQRVSTKA